MKIKEFYIVEMTHPNLLRCLERKVFTTKKEAFQHAKKMARETLYYIDVMNCENTIAQANYDHLINMGILFKVKDC